MNRRKDTGGLDRLLLLFRKKRPARDPSLATLQRAIDYRFKKISLLRLALTHKSVVSGEDPSGLESNERLEFLGDAVLNCCVTEYLYKTYPRRSEGYLSKIKSLIVSRKILGEIGMAIDLGQYLYLGVSERDSGGAQKPSIVSNAFEALLGAMYLDGGLTRVRRLLSKLLFPRTEEFLREKSNVNYKSKILELAQRDGFGIPRYTVLSSWGPEHAKTFKVRVEVAGVPLGEGSGPNKKIAQQCAAEAAVAAYDRRLILDTPKGERHDELVSE